MKHAAGTALAALALSAGPAFAQDSRMDALERQLSEQQQRVHQLETLVAEQAALLEELRAARAPAAPATAVAVAQPASPTPAATTGMAVPADARIAGLDVGGDLRVRQEFNWSDADARDRWRSVLRARVRATYAINSHFAIGGQIATGDADDPNSTDITLGSFDDDLDVSLDQAWIRYTNGGLTAFAGKFPQIFQRTDMIWDGDVVPQGVGATWSIPAGDARFDARAMYFVIDEAAAGGDSSMIGGQIVATVPLSSSFRINLAGSYYHYRLQSVGGADAGDFRSNLIANGRYLSDYRLVEALANLTWTGSARWPVALTADYVRNMGAAVSADTGYNVELAAGRIAQPGDWRIAYNYSQVGVDAVFAAFSHDNLNIATNYKLHGLAVAFVPARNLVLDLAYYHYRPLNPLYAGANTPTDWLDRLRLNFLVNF